MRAALVVILTLFASNAFAQGDRARVTDIRYVGLENTTPRDLETVLPFSLGDFWHEDLLASTRTAIAQYYERRGFYHARVTAQATPQGQNRVALNVKVEEGRPCVISSIWIDDPPGFQSKHVMQRLKDRMADILQVRAGDRYDEQVLTDRVRVLRDWLVDDQDFILANTDKVRLKFNDDRTGVEVVLAIDYGDRVTFGFRDNTVLTKGELSELILQARATGLGKDYVGAIQRKFIDEYKGRAYNGVRIDVRQSDAQNAKHVTFIFHEGVRVRLEELVWDGLSDANAAIARDVFQNGVSRLVQRGFFVERDIDKGILVVLEDLHSRGFLSAKLIAKSVQPLKAPKDAPRVKMSVQLAEGEQTLVSEIALSGNTHFDRDRILTSLSVSEGKPFNPFALEEGIQRLRALYVGEGYLDFKIVTKDEEIVLFGENNRTVNVQVKLYEGTRVHIGKIEVKGLQLTKEYVVRREIVARTDDWWLGSEIKETENNIRKLGLFADVKISPQQSERGPGYRDMLIELKEADPGVVEAGPGYRSDLGIRASGRVSYNNILGKNWIGSLGAEGNRRLNNDYRFPEYSLDANFIEPRFFGTRNLYLLGVSTKKQRFPPDFNAVSTTFSTGFERRLSRIVSTKLLYKLERIRQFDVVVDGQISDRDNQSMLIGSLNPSITLDTRDSPFTTSNGWLVTASLEYAHPYLSSQNVEDDTAPAYQKWTGAIRRYTSITKDIVWSNVVAGGFARSSVAGRPIPLIKLFRLGGYSTIRGFPEDAINVDAFSITGTLTFANLRSQVDLPLVGDLRLAPFVDAGNLYIDQLRGNPFFRASSGLGIHYMTPIGPINLDYGFKLNPVPGETPGQFHFSVGMI
jgi:outer membrane protein assembly complex protein YaeT